MKSEPVTNHKKIIMESSSTVQVTRSHHHVFSGPVNGHQQREVNGNSRNDNLNNYNTMPSSGYKAERFEIPLPFGYHMDLDFLRFCTEDLASGETLERLKELRKSRRKQRKQLEALMGFQREQRDKIQQHMANMNRVSPPSSNISRSAMQSSTLTFQHRPHTPVRLQISGDLTPTSELFVKEALQDAVQDFEQCLEEGAATVSSAKSKYHTFPRHHVDHHHQAEPPATPSELRERIEKLYQLQQSNSSSLSSISTSSSALPYHVPMSPDAAILAGLPSSVRHRSMTEHMETDSIGSITSEMSTTTLRNIREQMARSLSKLKEYEKQVEAIPVLQVKLSVLKEEKRLLMLKLKQREFQMRRERGEDSEGLADIDMLDDTEDEDLDQKYARMSGEMMRSGGQRYVPEAARRARSESPYAKGMYGGSVNPEEFISVRRKRSTSCGYNSDSSDVSPLVERRKYFDNHRPLQQRMANARQNMTASPHTQERSELSVAISKSVPKSDASVNTDPMKPEPPPKPVMERPVSRRERGSNTDPPVKTRTANHGVNTTRLLTFAKGSGTNLSMGDLVTKDEMEARVQEAIFKTEEEIMGCPLLQKAMAKVEEEAMGGGVTTTKEPCETSDVQCQVGDENLRPFVIDVGLQCRMDEIVQKCARCEEDRLNDETTTERFLAAVGASSEVVPPVPVRSIGVGECKLIEDPPDPLAFRDIGVCTEKWVEVIKASKQTDTEDFAFKDTESPRVADMVFEPSPERVVLQRRSSLQRKSPSPSASRRSSTHSPLPSRKASSVSGTTQTKSTPTKTTGTMTMDVKTKDAKTGGGPPPVATRTASTSAMMLPLVSKNLPAQGSPLTTPETERPAVRLNLCDKCNLDIQKVAEGIVAGPPPPVIHAPPSPDLPWLSKIPRPVTQAENPTVHKLKAATSTGNLSSPDSRPKSPMQRSKSNLTPTLGRKVLSPNSPTHGRRGLGTPPPHPATPPVGSKRVPSPLARSQSPYSGDKKSLIPKLQSGSGVVGKRDSQKTSGPVSPASAETRSLIPRVVTPPALRKMYPKQADKLATPDRNVVRKNTYTKASAGVSNPDLDKQRSSAIKSAIIKEDVEEDEGNKTDEETKSSSSSSSFPLPGAALFTPIDENRKKAEPSKEMRAALKVLNDSLVKGKPSGSAGVQVTNAINIVQQEWFKISSTKQSNPLDVEDYLDAIETDLTKELLERTVNLTDVNGNTALHYSVSHGNFDVVSVLLDSKVANPNILNKAGYTCIMLISLAQIANATHRAVVRRLFSLGDVNVRASQHGQTGLMLAVSHGRQDMVQLLVEAGADVNIRDEDGSTALMCAAEHGHMEIVKFLLSQSDTDVLAKDNDGLTALAVAMEAGHRDVGVILYASMSMSRGASPYSSMRLRSSATGSRTSTPTGSVKSSKTPPRSPVIAPTPPHRTRRTSSNQ